MSEIVFLVEESPEGGYIDKALGHSVFAEADTLEALEPMVRDAVRSHFDEIERPAVIRLHVVRNLVLAS